MNRAYTYRKVIIFSLIFFLISISITPVFGFLYNQNTSINKSNYLEHQEYPLPPPQFINMSLEETIMRRASMRGFSDEPVTDEELSTILWAAYGLREDGELTIAKINGSHAAVIFVLLEDVYTYNPTNHSLVFYKTGDYRDIVGWQYSAPVQLGLCWNTDLADANFGSAELGAIGQNIYFAANALNLGTVITAQSPDPAITPVGLPPNIKGMGVMPLGHPNISYNFKYRPLLLSFLPRIQCSGTSLTDALEERSEVTSWDKNTISRSDLSHLLWASYGYSYYLDKSDSGSVKRHHTLPSAHGYYPFLIYAMTKGSISRYVYGLYNIDVWGLPVISFLLKNNWGDKREIVAQASESFVADAPLCIIPVLDIQKTIKWDDLSNESVRWIWYYEAGAAAHNILLEATARGMAGNIIPIQDKDAICSLLKLDTEQFDPMFVIPVG